MKSVKALQEMFSVIFLGGIKVERQLKSEIPISLEKYLVLEAFLSFFFLFKEKSMW